MAYAQVRLDNMAGTTLGTKLKSAKFYVDTTATEIQNGMVVKIEGLVAGTHNLTKVVTPAKTDMLGVIGLVATPEVMYDERKRNLDEFINEADDEIRVYVLTSGDEFSVTAEALTGSSMVKGDIVEMDASTNLKVVKTATSGSTTIGYVDAVEVVGSKTYYLIHIN